MDEWVSYEIITANDAAGLSGLVTEALGNGWSLHYAAGTFCRPCGTTVFYQAVCK